MSANDYEKGEAVEVLLYPGVWTSANYLGLCRLDRSWHEAILFYEKQIVAARSSDIRKPTPNHISGLRVGDELRSADGDLYHFRGHVDGRAVVRTSVRSLPDVEGRAAVAEERDERAGSKQQSASLLGFGSGTEAPQEGADDGNDGGDESGDCHVGQSSPVAATSKNAMRWEYKVIEQSAFDAGIFEKVKK